MESKMYLKNQTPFGYFGHIGGGEGAELCMPKA